MEHEDRSLSSNPSASDRDHEEAVAQANVGGADQHQASAATDGAFAQTGTNDSNGSPEALSESEISESSDASTVVVSAGDSPRLRRSMRASNEASEARAQKRAAKEERRARKRSGPGIWRTWIFPFLRLAVVAAIAVALVKIAFFTDASANEGVDYPPPTAEIVDPMVQVQIATIVNTVDLKGTVVPDAAVVVRSTQSGTVSRVFATDGQLVAAGDSLYNVRVTTEATTPNPDGSMPAPSVRVFTITAPAGGVLTSFSLLLNQSVEIGAETGKVALPTFHLEAPLTPEQQYRLVDQPTEATVQIPGGPAPFQCTGFTIEQGGGEEGSTTSATAKCAVPAEVRVFSGLSAEISMPAGTAENVMTLPTTAVLGSVDNGVVFRVGADGSQEEVQVQLGLNDGQSVEITGGLAEGDEVFEFAPGAPMPSDPCMDPMADPALCGGFIEEEFVEDGALGSVSSETASV
ncbi:efflux RND transporter periplasmic adaptor subunit [Humidisolicoccus flavus]|uniref:efflux RND transporter periplasmic adaptor subunit n=1 Tax=Humidisolicoccus flavus TaxID=3111414 RepID=UPI00324AD2EB